MWIPGESPQTTSLSPLSTCWKINTSLFQKESQETIQTLKDQIREALPDTGQKTTDMERIIDRVPTLMATNFRDIKGAKRLKDKVKSLSATFRRRITELSKRILPMAEIQDPTGDGVKT